MKTSKYIIVLLLVVSFISCGGGASQPKPNDFQAAADWLKSIEVTDGSTAYTSESLQTIEALYLTSKEQVSDADLEKYVSKLTSLKVLTLDGTQVTNAGIASLAALSNLEYLQIPHLKGVDGKCLDDLSKLSGLRRLNLNNTGFQTADIIALAQKLPHLESLNLSKLNVNGAMAEIGKMQKLKSLDLNYTDLNDEGIKSISQLVSLESLSMTDAKVTDVGMTALEPLINLTSLNLANVKITDNGLGHLKNMANLGILLLGQSDITDAGLEKLAGNKALWSLSVHGTKVTDAGVEKLKEALPKISIQR